MMASASGRPSVPARTTDCGVPPTAIQIGSLFLERARIDAAIVDRRRVAAARPGHRLALAQPHEQLQLLGEQRVVVVEIVAEQREALDEGAAPGHDLGASVRDQVERRELLEDAHRIVRAQHRDRAGQPDGLRPRGGGREDHGRSGSGWA